VEIKDGTQLAKKTAARAALSTGNVVSGALSLAASAVLWNPLPLILWGLGSTGYVFLSTTSDKKLKQTLDADRAAAERGVETQRETDRRSLEVTLSSPPFVDWIRYGLVPDYARQYLQLRDMRDNIIRLAHDRSEVELVTELGIQRQLNYMLGAFLQFVKARAAYLRILSSVKPPEANIPPLIPPPLKGSSPRVHGSVPGRRVEMPNPEELLQELTDKISRLKELSKKEPASAKAREWHVGILEKQKTLIQECWERDQAVAAQLEAFPDAFNVVLGRVSAAQFDPNDVASTMDTLVERVEETERFVKAFAPAMDQMLGGLPSESA